MTSGSSMLAMMRSLPPQPAQVSISMPKTRFRRRAQLIATWGGIGGLPSAPGSAFLEAAGGELGALGLQPGRMICGRVTLVATPKRTYQARSLMVAGLTPEQSLTLQRQGLGAGRSFGCGLCIPHKDIADLRSRED